MSRSNKTSLRLQAFEDRNMPATFNYVAGTLSVTAADNDAISITNSTNAPVGYLRVSDGINTFDSLTNSQPVKNLIVNMSPANISLVSVLPGTILTGNVNVLGAKEKSYFYNLGFISKNLTYTAAANDALDVVELSSGSAVVGNTTLKLGAGNNTANLSGGTLLGNLKITGGAGADEVPLTHGEDVEVKGSVSINLGAGNNSVTSADNGVFTVGKDFTYIGGAGDDDFDLNDAFQTELKVGGKMKVSLGDSVGPFNHFSTGNLTVAGSMTITGGNKGDGILMIGNASVGGTVTMNLGNGSNYLGVEGLFTSGSLNIVGGLDADTIFLDRLAIAKNFSVDVKGDRTLSGQTVAVGSQEGDENIIFGSASLRTGAGEDVVIFHRATVAGGLKISTGSEHDFVGIDDVSVAGSTIIGLGVGSDNLDVDNANSDSGGNLDENTTFGGIFTVKAGIGDDKVRLSSTGGNLIKFGGKVSLIGGIGTDTFENTVLNEFFIPNAFEDFEADNGVALP